MKHRNLGHIYLYNNLRFIFFVVSTIMCTCVFTVYASLCDKIVHKRCMFAFYVCMSVKKM